MSAAIHRLGVVGLIDAYAAGRVSVVDAIDTYLDRIARFDPGLNVFTSVDVAGARAAAATSAARLAAGTARPLEGVPIAVKANIDVADMRVHGGTGALAGRVASQDAEVIGRLKDAGAIILGMLNMHEAALGATTDNKFFGTCQNPHRIGFTPGGSSGGSGAAVAAGLCAAALGTDTLGSVRIPAAYCGVFGLKGTNGLVSNSGLMLLVERLDCIGPLARSVADLAAVMAAMADLPPAEDIRRIATLSSTGTVETAPAVRAAHDLACNLLGGLGIAVAERKAAIDPHKVRLAGFIEATQEGQRHFGALVAQQPDGFSEDFRSLLAFGQRIDAQTAARNRAVTDAAASQLHAILQLDDAILLPTTPQAAFPHGQPAPASQADFTALANLAGLPAISLPAGWTADGLPVAVQIIGRQGSEVALLALAATLSSALNAFRPPIGYE